MSAERVPLHAKPLQDSDEELCQRQFFHFDPKNLPPLCNLYVNMLQRLGIAADKFGTSTGTLTGLELSRGVKCFKTRRSVAFFASVE